MLYYLARRILSRHDQPQPNPEVSRRLDSILASREEEYADFVENEDDNAYYSDIGYDEKTGARIPNRRRRKRPSPSKRTPISLTSYEQSIASEVVHPSTIPVSFADIGGLDDIISDLQESVIYPLTLPSLYQRSALLSAPSGVLLYGPPGCGKTMLAKALAHESGAVFINLHISTLTEKWYGDSNKLVAAVFSLARKLAPSIVFVDEIDAVFGTRRSSDHEASAMVKAEMMTHWDGLSSADAAGRPQQVLILGATNRFQDIDEAILRRMPKKFAINLPKEIQRERIFKLVLRESKLDFTPRSDAEGPESDSPAFDLDWLVRMSEGMSGSEIKECCREAAMAPMREMIQAKKARGEDIRGARPKELRGLRTEDFMPYFISRMQVSRDVTNVAQRPYEMRALLDAAFEQLKNMNVSARKRSRTKSRNRSIKNVEELSDVEYESVPEDEEQEKPPPRKGRASKR